MKPFNLEEALKGAPVRLNNGRKAFVLYDLRKHPNLLKASGRLPLNGIMMGNSEDDGDHVMWDETGKCESSHHCIIGMWEETKLTKEQILEKAYNENLKVTFNKAMFTNGYEVIAKTKDGKYILRNGSSHLTQVHEGMTSFRIYEEKPSTVTVTLPKPIIPEEDQKVFFLQADGDGELYVDYCEVENPDHFRDGNCFKTKEDAQAWLNAMKGALDAK